MKRLLFLFFLICLLLSALSTSAFAQETLAQSNFDFDLVFESEGDLEPIRFSSLFVDKGKIYLFGNGLAELDVESKKIHWIPKMEYREDMPCLNNLLPGEDTFYSLSAEENTLYSLKIEDGKLVVDKLQSPVYEGKLSWDAGENALVEEGVLYFLSTKLDPESPTGEKNAIVAYNLKTKERKEFAEKSFQAISPYKDGKLLTYTLERDKEGQFFDKGNITIGLIDINLGVFMPLYHFGTPNMLEKAKIFYHKASDSVCYITGNAAYRVYSKTEAKLCSYVPESRDVRAVAELKGGNIIMLVDCMDSSVMFSGVVVRNLDESVLPQRTLNIWSLGNRDELFEKARKNMPDVPIVLEEVSWGNSDEIAANIITAGDSFDVLEVDGENIDVRSLLSKGYAYPIESEILKNHVGSMHSALKESALKDGKLYLIPKDINMDVAFYSKEGFKKFGINIPKTYADLLDAEYAFARSENEEKNTYQFSVDSNVTLHNVITYYARAYAAENKEINFDTSLFRNLMGKVLRNDEEIRREKVDWRNEIQMKEMFEKKDLFLLGTYLNLEEMEYQMIRTPSKEETRKTLLLLRVSEESEPFVSIRASYYLLNPRSKNLDLAIRFLENYVSSMSEKDKAPLYAGMKEAIPNPNYEREREYLVRHLELTKKKYEEAESAEKANLEIELKFITDETEKLLERAKYIISKETMDAYHDMMSNKQVLVDANVDFVTRSGKVLTMDIYKRFAAGQMSIDQLIQELNNKVKLITMEKGK